MGLWHSGGAAGSGPGVYSGMGWGAGFFGGVMMLLFLGVLILAAIWLVRSLRRGGYGWPSAPAQPAPEAAVSDAAAVPAANDQALAIVKERYARGEIDRETYEQMRKNLSI
jgi:putative membrane protein